MHKKNNELIMRIPNPFDDSAQTRLVRMGVVNKDGQINQEVLSTFAAIFTGLFFDDICDFYSDTEDLLTVYNTFFEFYSKEDHQHMYLLFSIQYDYIRKPLPDPVWWLAGNGIAVKEFMTRFMVRYKELMIEAGFIKAGGEADKK